MPVACDLTVFTFPTSVHDDPSQDSTFAVLFVAAGADVTPEITIAAVPVNPALPDAILPVFISATSVHEEPSQVSLALLYSGEAPGR